MVVPAEAGELIDNVALGTDDPVLSLTRDLWLRLSWVLVVIGITE